MSFRQRHHADQYSFGLKRTFKASNVPDDTLETLLLNLTVLHTFNYRTMRINRTLGVTACLLLPALAQADNINVLSACPSVQLLSTLASNGSGCVDGPVVFSDFWAVSVGWPGETSPSAIDVQFPSSTDSESDIGFTGGFTLDGGSTGAVQIDLISFMISMFAGGSIDHLNLTTGALHQTGTGGLALVQEVVSGNGSAFHTGWMPPGDSSKITFARPVDRVRVFDVVLLSAPPHNSIKLDSFSDPVTAIPEPQTIVMLGAVLLALARIARRVRFGA